MRKFQEQLDSLFAAELQFRLASAVTLASSLGNQPTDLPMEWTHGEHRVTYGETALRSDQADFAAWCLQRSATYMLAMAAKDAIRVALDDPKNSPDFNIRGAYQISRLIRNAFAHAPFDPVWSIDGDCQDKVFEVEAIIKLDARNLNGQRFDWRHYGGPLALLRLSQFVRANVLGEEPKQRTLVPLPKNVYLQQGDIILQRIVTDSGEDDY